MKLLILVFSIFFIVSGTAACGSSGGAKADAEPPANTTADSKTMESKPADSADKANLTGIAVCDEYLSKVEVCLNKPNVPEATQSAYRQSLEQNRAAWKQAASSSQGRTSLEASCKMAIDSAKPFFESCR